jgi:hypothetical protein
MHLKSTLPLLPDQALVILALGTYQPTGTVHLALLLIPTALGRYRLAVEEECSPAGDRVGMAAMLVYALFAFAVATARVCNRQNSVMPDMEGFRFWMALARRRSKLFLRMPS